MSPQERILEQLKAYLVDQSEEDLRPEDIDADVGFFDYGYLDSLGVTTFLAFVDSEYAVRISDEDLVARFTTLAELTAHIALQQK